MERLVEWNCKEKNSALPLAINEDGDTVPMEDICAQLATIYDILGDDYDLDRLRELVKADWEGRCVIYQPGYSVIRTYNPKDEDGLYTMEACGVVSEKEYKDALKGE